MEKLCPRYNKELYKQFNIFIKPHERLSFPKVTSPAEFVYTKEKNYSHSTVFKDDGDTKSNLCESKFQYRIPNSVLVGDNDGIRRKLLEKFLWKQMAKEVIDELVDRNEVENYCSEYDSNYYKENFEPEDVYPRENKELQLKYPLHGTGSNAVTYYSYAVSNQKNILHPFKKSTAFTKSQEE